MKRIQDKVKDIVEVRPFRSIRDFTADPAETLANYRFTDATADLMAKWLEGISAVQSGKGAAFALAGYRGVGKSHFLATLGALASSPDLRGRVSESHVEFSAQRLQRRHYPVCFLKRGTHATLLDEFKASVESTFQLEVKGLSSFREVLDAVSEKFSDAAWVLLIDTALERGSRVTRDDGEHLSEIAEAGKARGVFVGVALDDDIAGADGSNSAIVRSFAIDYLDQAHLYKVVNSHVFPKVPNMQPVLHEVYSYFREVLPSFRWSEQKFSALYPLHPATLEVAPYVRLYVHEFALLGFASEAGERIMGRPANSLIALDEVYDNAENGLRKIEDLREAFAAYDAINSTVVSKVPVMQRLQAKLILKALLMLSLDGQGATASEICASELIFDEAEPQHAVETVEGLLRTFAEALPDGIRVTQSDASEIRYGFKVTSKESLNNALVDAVSKAPADAAETMLRRVFQERFPEAAGPNGTPFGNEIRTELLWRGAARPGRILWSQNGVAVSPDAESADDWTDWEVHVDLDGAAGTAAESAILWRPDALRPEELEKLRSYYVLTANAELRDKFSEQIRAALHAHSMAAEKILTRTFLEDAKLVIDGFDYNFTEEARAAQTLPEIFGSMLEPLFETRYPSHPYFAKPLGHEDVSSIITDLYDSTRRDLSDTQSRAQAFAFPLGLVRLEGTAFAPETADRIGSLSCAKTVLDAVDAAAGTAPLADVNAKLRQPPYGLGREAQQILITALVAERLLEFVTTSGNRINSRSLDLKIIWADIAGLARPVEVSSAAHDLSAWAKLFVKDGGFTSLTRDDDRQGLLEAFAKWVAGWESDRVLEKFAEIPEDLLNVGVWRLAARTTKTFGAVIDKVSAAARGEIPIEECLSRVAETFSFSPEEFVAGEADLESLRNFVAGVAFRQAVREYVAAAEVTEVEDIEASRARIAAMLNLPPAANSAERDRELSYVWDKFRREYGDHFAARHAEMAHSNERKAKLDELLRGAEWTEFEFLSRLPAMDKRYPSAADQYRRQLAESECVADARPLLELQPFCRCGFSLRRSASADFLYAALNDTIRKGLDDFRKFIANNREQITSGIETLIESSPDAEVAAAGRELGAALRADKQVQRFTDLQLKIFAEILREHDRSMNISNRKHATSPSGVGNEESFASLASEEFADRSDLLLV